MKAQSQTDLTTQVNDSIPLTQEALKEAYEQLQKQNQQLQHKLDEQSEIIDKKSGAIGAQIKRITALEEKLRFAKHKQYSASGEKNALQSELFIETELLADGESDVSGEITPEPATEKDTPKKRKKRKGLSPELVREQVIHSLSDEEKKARLTLSL